MLLHSTHAIIVDSKWPHIVTNNKGIVAGDWGWQNMNEVAPHQEWGEGWAGGAPAPARLRG